MSNIWFISDTHFGSESIKSKCYRPDNWQNLLLDNIHKKLGPDDTLIHLGDIGTLRFSSYEPFFREINCKNKTLVLGNHDTCLSDIDKEFEFDCIYPRESKPFLIEKFDSLGIKVAIRLSHEPMIFDEEIKKRVKDDDLIEDPIPIVLNIHGHLHNLAKIESVFPHFNVSVEETNYDIISLSEIMEKKKKDIITYYNKLLDLGLIK